MASNRLPLYYVVTMLYWFSIYTYVPLLSPYVSSLGGSLGMAGIIIGSYGFTQMLVRIPLGIWSDRLRRRKPFVIAGLVVGSISSVGLGLTHTAALVLVFRGLAGVAAASWVVFTVLYASYQEDNHASRAMGVISFYTSLGQMAASVLGGMVANRYGWHAAFFTGAIGGCVGIILAFGIRERAPDPNARGIDVSALLQVGRDRIVLGVSTLAVLAQVITFSTMFGFTPKAATNLGASKLDLSLLSLVSTLPNAVASIYGVRGLARLVGERGVIAIGFFTSTVFTAAIPLVHSLPGLYVTQAFNGFAQGLCMPVLMGMSIQHVDTQRRATAMGFFQAIYSLGMFGGPALCGAIGDVFGLNGSFFVVAVVSLGASACTFLLAPSGRKHPASVEVAELNA